MRQARKRKFTFRATLYKHQPSWKLGCNFKTPKCASDTGRGEDRCTPVITNDAAFYSTLLYYDKTDNSRIFVVHANIDRHWNRSRPNLNEFFENECNIKGEKSFTKSHLGGTFRVAAVISQEIVYRVLFLE